MDFLLHLLQHITVYSKNTDTAFLFNYPVLHIKPFFIPHSVFNTVVVFPNYSSFNTNSHAVNN